MPVTTPFRVLFREFLFRVVELDWLASHGDTQKLLGQIAALLVFVSAGFGLAALGAADATDLPPQIGLLLTWSEEHFLIATTMLATGLLAVLSWDSTFPNRRDVMVLAPLPVRARTIFLAKVAAVGCALGVTVASLHLVAGIAWPVALFAQGSARVAPAMVHEAAVPAVNADGLGAMLERELEAARQSGSAGLTAAGVGLVVGVLDHGTKRVFAYGRAKPDSLFEIGSISKTFTALLLAKMARDQRVRLEEPVRALLPEGTVARPPGREIRLLDLATHHSGLPQMPDNFEVTNRQNPMAGYQAAHLYAYVAKKGLQRGPNPGFEYSNLGFALLGTALASRAGTSYEALLAREVTGPLGLTDTVVTLSPEQHRRFLTGIGVRGQAVPGWDMDAMAGAGGIRSTAGDMLTYLEAQLGGAPGALGEAIEDSQRLRAEVATGYRIGLAWLYTSDTGIYWHNGGTGGFSSDAFFDRKRDRAAVVLVNESPGVAGLAGILSEHVRERLAGEPALSLQSVPVAAASGVMGFIRVFAAYWATMVAAGIFVYGSLLGLQGAASQLLPRRWFLRLSVWLQMGAFYALLGGYLLQPAAITPAAILEAQGRGVLSWSPSFWFLGWMQQLNGSEALGPLARRAWVALGVMLVTVVAAYGMSYFRTLRRILEEPDLVGTSGGRSWTPGFGGRVPGAVAQFSLRTVWRSRQHRLILAFYWGVALALVIFLTKSPGLQRQLRGEDAWREPNVPLLAASVLVLCSAIVAVRVVMSLPLELAASWIFQVTGVPGGRRGMAAVRRAMYVLGPGPIWLAAGVVFFWLWEWRAAVGHLAVLGLLGVTLTELCLYRFHKIPFACSYLPGKSRANLVVLGYMGVVFLMVKGAELERQALRDSDRLAPVLVVLGIVGVMAWLRNRVTEGEAVLRFEEVERAEIEAFSLRRDGTPPLR